MKEVVFAKEAPAAIGPYSHAVKAGNMVFLSGQIGLDPATGKMVEGITEQTKQVFANIKAVLAEVGCTLADVVKTTVYLNEMYHFGVMNDIYAEEFGDARPARSAIAVKELPRQALVEIEVIAMIP